jgi:hypothetical protein
MKIFTFVLALVTSGDACKESAKAMHTTFTGDAEYWNPAFNTN